MYKISNEKQIYLSYNRDNKEQEILCGDLTIVADCTYASRYLFPLILSLGYCSIDIL